MNPILDEKRKAETQAVDALKNGRLLDARKFALAAAKLADALAARASGSIAESHRANAQGWRDIVARLEREIAERRVAAPTANGRQGASGQDHTKPADAARNVKYGEKDSSEPSDCPWALNERSNVTLDDVAGLDELKRIVNEDLIGPMKYPEAYRLCGIEPGGGALLYGPPGTGKTFVARAIAGEIDAKFFTVSPGQLKSKYVGETEQNMRKLFEAAYEYKNAVIFIDEIHALLPASDGDVKTNQVEEFLQLSDGVVRRKNNIFLLGATNYPWLVNEAVFRRLENLIYVGLPDEPARKKIFKAQFKGAPCGPSFDFDAFARQTDGFSGADIRVVCGSAKKKAIFRAAQSADPNSPIVENQDVWAALREAKLSTDVALLRKYDEWAANRSSANK